MKKLSTLTLLIPMFLLFYDNIAAQTTRTQELANSISGPTRVACNTRATFFFNRGIYTEITTPQNDFSIPEIRTIFCNSIATWTVTLPNGAIRSLTGSSVSINLGDTPGEARFSASTFCGSTRETVSYTVNVGGLRLPTPSILGAGFLCNTTTARYTIPEVSGAVSYTIEVPSGWNLNNTGFSNWTTTSRTFTLRPPTTGAGAGSIRVRANANSGCDINSIFRTKNIAYGRRNIELFGPTRTAPNKFNLL